MYVTDKTIIKNRIIEQLQKYRKLSGMVSVILFLCDYVFNGETFSNVVQPLVSNNQWYAVQDILAQNETKNSAFHPRSIGSNQYLLNGLLFCGACGKKMWGYRSKKNYGYKCSGQKINKTNCHGTISTKIIDSEILDWVSNYLLKPEFVIATIQQRINNLRETIVQTTIIETDLIGMLKQIKREQGNIANAIANGIPIETVREKSIELAKREKIINEQLLRIHNLPIATDINLPTSEQILSLCEHLKLKFSKTDAAELKSIIKSIIVRVEYVGKHKMKIHYRDAIVDFLALDRVGGWCLDGTPTGNQSIHYLPPVYTFEYSFA